MTRTIVVTGSASGLGAAARARLGSAGNRVIGVDIRDADVQADLGTPDGRRAAIAGVEALVDGSIDGVVACAGLGGLTDRPGSLLVSVNYFGTVVLLDGLRPLLAKGSNPAVVVVSSNSTTCQPRVPIDVVDQCLEGDEKAACQAADAVGSLAAYPATKLAVAWWARRQAPSETWAGAGITLNAIAPGAIETPLLAATRADPTVGALVDAFPIPVGRTGSATEIAALIEFLLGPDARFFCGSVLYVDGGTDAALNPRGTPTPLL